MCLVCTTHGDPENYLTKFAQAKMAMEASIKAMEVYARRHKDTNPNYDRCHKEMVRISKSWNSVDQIREEISS